MSITNIPVVALHCYFIIMWFCAYLFGYLLHIPK